MVDHVQYPIWAAIDPTTLDAPTRDELQWYLNFSLPVPRKIRAEEGWFTIDPITPPDPVVVTLDEYQPLSIPVVLPTPASIGWFTIDAETLGAPLSDKIEWYQDFSVPVPLALQAYPGTSVIDPETLSEPTRDEIQWYQEFSTFIPLARQAYEGTITSDPETLNDPLDDKIGWFQPFSTPLHIVAKVIEAGNIFVDELAVVDDKSFEWFAPLSEPVLPTPLYQSTEAAVIDPETLSDITRDELQWFMSFSLPVLRPMQAVESASTFFIEGDDPPPPIPSLTRRVWREGTARSGGLLTKV